MSQENVETVRAGFAAWNAGDMDAVGELLAEDVVLRLLEGWPEPGPYVGREATMRQYAQTAPLSTPTDWKQSVISSASATAFS